MFNHIVTIINYNTKNCKNMGIFFVKSDKKYAVRLARLKLFFLVFRAGIGNGVMFFYAFRDHGAVRIDDTHFEFPMLGSLFDASFAV